MYVARVPYVSKNNICWLAVICVVHLRISKNKWWRNKINWIDTHLFEWITYMTIRTIYVSLSVSIVYLHSFKILSALSLPNNRVLCTLKAWEWIIMSDNIEYKCVVCRMRIRLCPKPLTAIIRIYTYKWERAKEIICEYVPSYTICISMWQMWMFLAFRSVI